MCIIVRWYFIFKMYRNRVMRRRKYTQLRSRVIGSSGYAFRSKSGGSSSSSGSSSGASSKRPWSDPLGLGRKDPAKVAEYDVIEARDGNLYMNVGGRWVIPGASNWRDARASKANKNPDEWWSQWRYNPNHGSIRPLYPRDEL